MFRKDGAMAELTKEQRRSMGRKGGIASGESRRRKAKIKEAVAFALKAKATDQDAIKIMREQGIEDKDMTNAMAIAVTIVSKAVKGDIAAVKRLQTFTGELAMSEQERAEHQIKLKELEIKKLELEIKKKKMEEDDWQ